MALPAAVFTNAALPFSAALTSVCAWACMPSPDVNTTKDAQKFCNFMFIS